MDEKRKAELQPLVMLLDELPPDEREKVSREIKGVRALGETLFELSEWCAAQGGAVAWTLMQTMDNGRRGFQLFIVDHDPPWEGDERDVLTDIWHCNARELGRVNELVCEWLRSGPSHRSEKRTIGGQ